MARTRPASPGPVSASPTPPNHQPEFTYPVLSPLRHNGRHYGPGEEDGATVVMTEAQAETLIAIGVLGEAAPADTASEVAP